MSTPTPTGVIHDIGYRHYEGERLARGYIRRSLLIDTLRGAYGLGRSGRYKVMPMILFAVMCLPAGAIVAISAVTSSRELVGPYSLYLVNLQMILLVFLAAQAPVTVSRDLRFGVMPLYFSRPMERVDYVLSKYGGMAAALFVLTATPLTIMLIGALVIKLPISEQISDYLRAVAGAALLSVILAGIGLVIAAFTPRRGLAVGAIIAVLLVLVTVQAILDGLLASEGFEAPYLDLMSPFSLVQGIQVALFGSKIPIPPPPGAIGTLIFCSTAVLIVAGSFMALLWRYRRVSAT